MFEISTLNSQMLQILELRFLTLFVEQTNRKTSVLNKETRNQPFFPIGFEITSGEPCDV